MVAVLSLNILYCHLVQLNVTLEIMYYTIQSIFILDKIGYFMQEVIPANRNITVNNALYIMLTCSQFENKSVAQPRRDG